MIKQKLFDTLSFVIVLCLNLPKFLYYTIISDGLDCEFFDGFLRPYPHHEPTPPNFFLQLVVICAMFVDIMFFVVGRKYLHDFLIEEVKNNMIISIIGAIVLFVGIAVNVRNQRRFLQYDLFYQELCTFRETLVKEINDAYARHDNAICFYEMYKDELLEKVDSRIVSRETLPNNSDLI